MKKLSAELTLNASGYKQGIDEAKRGTEAYMLSAKKSDKEIKELNKTFRKAQQEARALSIAYNQLSAAQKASAEGKALQKQMNDAIANAGQLRDIVDDTTASIKAMASDTANLDALKEGFQIGKSAALTYAGAIVKLTGDEKSLQQVIGTITMVEHGFNTAIQIGNALQKQSALMMGVKRVQALAAAKAVALETTATNGATIAQRTFNAVAKANPYVLLATAIIAVGTALVGFAINSKKAAEEEAELAKQAELSKEKFDAIAQSLESDLVAYSKLQAEYKACKSEMEKMEFIDANKQKFNDLGVEINNVADADNFLINNTQNVRRAFLLRAQAAGAAALAAATYKRAIEQLNALEGVKAGERIKVEDAGNLGFDMNKLKTENGGFLNPNVYVRPTQEAIAEARANIMKSAETEAGKFLDQATKLNEQTEKTLSDSGVKTFSKVAKKTNQAVSKSGTTTVQTHKTQLQKLKDEVTKWETALEDIDIDLDAPDTQKLIKEIHKNLDKALQNLKDYRIKVGLEAEKVEVPKSKLDKLKDDLKNAETRLEFAPDDESVNKIHEEIAQIKENIEKEEIRLKIKVKEPEQQLSASDWIQSDINALESEYQQMLDNFGGVLPEPNTEEWKQIENIFAEITRLKEIQAQIEDPIGYMAEKNIKKFEALEDTIGSVGSALSSLSQISDDESFNVAGIIMETIANLALSFSKAMGTTKHWTEWLAFGVSGMAQLLAMTAQIKSIGAFAGGGIIGGNSYSGDKLLANVNSGEMILNSRQQKRLFDIANNNSMYQPNNSNVTVTGVIRGKDLLLVQKNTNSILSKSNQTILF